MAKRILLIGAGGLLGGHVLKAARRLENISPFPIFHSFIPPIEETSQYKSIDISEIEEVDQLFNESNPDVVVNMSCMAVGDSEKKPDLANRIHINGPANIARVCGRSIRFVHISTDMVFSGRKGTPYTIDDEPDPISVYGKTKLAGEREILKRNGNSVILRSALIIGSGYYRHGGFIDWMAENFMHDKKVRLFTDQLRTPIAIIDLVEGILALCMSDYRGTMLSGGQRGVNRVVMGEWLLSGMGKPENLINSISMNEFKSDSPLQKDLRLDSSTMGKVCKITFADIETYIKKLGREYAHEAVNPEKNQ